MGGGGGHFFPSHPESLRNLVEKAIETAEQQRVEGDVNTFLQDLLMTLNQRDSEKIAEYLEQLRGTLEKDADIEQLLFGGSVAKHTFVDGLSDIDALVILNRDDLAGRTPAVVLAEFYKTLKNDLTSDVVSSVEKGALAVTVDYRDGTQIQLLPALRKGATVIIANSDGTDWKQINPTLFRRALTKANEGLAGLLVPAIKLVKAIVNPSPEQKRIDSYHLEALAVEAAKNYRGPATPRAVLLHILEVASKRILTPISDVTGQSSTVDAYLGVANSGARRQMAHYLAGIARNLKSATSLDKWKEAFQV